MKKLYFFILAVLPFSCTNNLPACQEPSQPYWSTTLTGKPHNTRIQGENITIRKAFQELVNSEVNIEPNKGFITLRLHLDKSGNFCYQENFQINADYQSTQFNDGALIQKLEYVSSQLTGWQNDTNSKTYYLIRLKIEHGRIAEIY